MFRKKINLFVSILLLSFVGIANATNPVIINCPANTWTRVGVAVNGVNMKPDSTKPNVYLYTFKDVGSDAPTDLSDATILDTDKITEIFVNTNDIDVYVYPRNKDGRVWVWSNVLSRGSFGRQLARYTTTTTTLSAPAAFRGTSIDIQSADYGDYVIGDYLELKDTIFGEKAFLRITDKPLSPTLTLSWPLDFPYLAGSTITKVDVDLSDTVGTLDDPVSFITKPLPNQVWQITAISSLIESTQSMDTSKFGSLTELKNGLIIIAHVRGAIRTVGVLRNNGDIIQLSGKQGGFYSKGGGGGSHGLQVDINLEFDKILRPLILNGASGDYLEFLIQDNFTATPGLTKFEVFVQGNILVVSF